MNAKGVTDIWEWVSRTDKRVSIGSRRSGTVVATWWTIPRGEGLEDQEGGYCFQVKRIWRR